MKKILLVLIVGRTDNLPQYSAQVSALLIVIDTHYQSQKPYHFKNVLSPKRPLAIFQAVFENNNVFLIYIPG